MLIFNRLLPLMDSSNVEHAFMVILVPLTHSSGAELITGGSEKANESLLSTLWGCSSEELTLRANSTHYLVFNTDRGNKERNKQHPL